MTFLEKATTFKNKHFDPIIDGLAPYVCLWLGPPWFSIGIAKKLSIPKLNHGGPSQMFLCHASEPSGQNCAVLIPRLGISVTTQGGSGRQCVTGPRRNISKYRFVLFNVYRYRET